ncbi:MULTISPECIES: hypothetical protein [unclassified Clostridium]|uniref:hypothetical protein n=1 Tax=unclassified Clostridium TaxID=2614128 RepID=UPI001C8CDAD5|nr:MULTISPECIES: hypothetical protein [unclassified Clostridium]MBX9136475.1 hypothetical protein [Clostridium sp. K12(2020)]MBX9143044.1 hypothetical protein [Clostridium sp. K13]
MSLFLGKIHYWLFNKVLWFQGLEDEIIEFAKTKGLDIDNLKSKINLKYGEKLPNKNLEDMIDTSNIHGWLQSKIHSAEGRMAAWTREILSNDQDFILDMKKIYNKQGINAAKEAKVKFSIITAEDIFNSMNDYILDGMPCDRVNEVVSSNNEVVEWKKRVCVHKEIWENEGISVDVFYDLRSEWIKAFVSEMNSDYEYVKLDENLQSIRKKV